ncbi:MAG: hypothetical protein K2X03_11610 [Bryobacteraceae bacterium]|nr:hypothetical protein [Bryobacteraceae bacterium]
MVLNETAEQLRDSINAASHWHVVMHPKSFQADRIPTLGHLWTTMEGCSVGLRGWDYPHVDRENRRNGPDWISSWCDYAGKREYWKFFQSGQFAHVLAFNEDSPPGAAAAAFQRAGIRAKDASGIVEVVELIYRTTEIFEFASRLALRTRIDCPMSFKISLVGTGGRLLTKQSAPFWGYKYLASEPNLEYSREVPLDELVGESANLAIECASWFFDRFGWHDQSIPGLKEQQRKLLSRSF